MTGLAAEFLGLPVKALEVAVAVVKFAVELFNQNPPAPM